MRAKPFDLLETHSKEKFLALTKGASVPKRILSLNEL